MIVKYRSSKGVLQLTVGRGRRGQGHSHHHHPQSLSEIRTTPGIPMATAQGIGHSGVAKRCRRLSHEVISDVEETAFSISADEDEENLPPLNTAFTESVMLLDGKDRKQRIVGRSPIVRHNPTSSTDSLLRNSVKSTSCRMTAADSARLSVKSRSSFSPSPQKRARLEDTTASSQRIKRRSRQKITFPTNALKWQPDLSPVKRVDSESFSSNRIVDSMVLTDVSDRCTGDKSRLSSVTSSPEGSCELSSRNYTAPSQLDLDIEMWGVTDEKQLASASSSSCRLSPVHLSPPCDNASVRHLCDVETEFVSIIRQCMDTWWRPLRHAGLLSSTDYFTIFHNSEKVFYSIYTHFF